MTQKSVCEIELNETQYDALAALNDAACDVAFLIGGIGSGKTFLLAAALEKYANELPYSLGLLTAPVFDQLNNSTVPPIVSALEDMGVIEGVDFVIGQAPASWGVIPYQKLRKYKVMTWRNGTTVILDGSDNFRKHKGLELDFILADEIQFLKPGSLELYIGRLRGKATKAAGKRSKMLGVGNQPEDTYQVERWEGIERVRVFEAPTQENARNLPKHYISNLAAIYDDVTYRREVLGERVPLGEMLAAYNFRHDLSPLGNLVDQPFNPKADAWLTCDFNASMLRPMSWFLIQKNQQGADVVVMEFVNRATSTESQSIAVAEYLTEQGFQSKLFVRGDATGGDRARNSATTRSDYEVMRSELKSTKWQYMGENTRRTKRVKDRIRALTSRIEARDGSRRLYISPKCKKLLESIKRCRWAENGIELESDKFEDAIAALSYFCYYEYPVHHGQPTFLHR